MRQKFLVIAKQFCRNNSCSIYLSSSGDEPVESFTAKENIYRGLFWYDLKREDMAIKNITNFSEFAEKLNCQ
jgi:hypothetical protein